MDLLWGREIEFKRKNWNWENYVIDSDDMLKRGLARL